MEKISQKAQSLQELGKCVLSKASIIYIISDEEDRVEGLLKELTATFQPKPKLFVWHPFHGLTSENEKIENSTDPLDALDRVMQRTEQTLFLFEGLHPFIQKDPSGDRKLKDVHRMLRNRYSIVFIVPPYPVIHEELRRDIIRSEE